MKNNKDSALTPKELVHELQALVAEAERMVGDSQTDDPAGALDSLRGRFAAAQERLADTYAGVRKQVVAGAKCTDDAIRGNPYQSLAIALGVGVLVGVLVGRRDK